MQELVMYMHAFVFLFGISICLKDDKHVRIDVISNKLDEKIKRVIEKLGLVLLIIPCLLYTSPSPRDRLLSRMPSSA